MKVTSLYIMGIDLGGTNIVSLLINKKGEIITRDKRKALAEEGKEKTISQIVESAKAVIEKGRNKGISFQSILGIGIGSPGPLNTKEGIIYFAPNLPGWKNVPLKNILEKKLNIPVFLENDANAAALGEWWIGAGRDVNNLVLFTLGTGIGGGIIINGEVLHGFRDTAAEIGHMIIHEEGLLCNCGTKGCLEAYASATGVVRRTISALKKGAKSILTEMVNNHLKEITCKMVYQAAKKGDKLCKWITEETGRYLGIGIANMVNILNPEMIILAGGMIEAKDLLFNPVIKYAQKYALKASIEKVKIVPAHLGDNAGAIGAAATVLKRKGNL
ncbi:ROK family protein [Candidatus Aerophobetes bacterium]|nr:ROK family protein [Candidatus Aerophobetes bacterium]